MSFFLSRRGKLLSEHGFTPCLHEIGNLQRNKVKLIIESVGLIRSLDNFALAEEINKQAAKFGRVVPVLTEVNSAKEDQKDGVHPEECEELYSREEVISVLEEELGKPINAKTYINDSAPMLKRRERINKTN